MNGRRVRNNDLVEFLKGRWSVEVTRQGTHTTFAYAEGVVEIMQRGYAGLSDSVLDSTNSIAVNSTQDGKALSRKTVLPTEFVYGQANRRTDQLRWKLACKAGTTLALNLVGPRVYAKHAYLQSPEEDGYRNHLQIALARLNERNGVSANAAFFGEPFLRVTPYASHPGNRRTKSFE